MSIPPKKLKYPYTWGRSKIQEFVEKYARGTKNLCTLCSIDPMEIRHKLILVICSGRSIKWETLKGCIKTLEDYEDRDILRFTEKERKLLHKCLVVINLDNILDGESLEIPIDMVRQRRLF
ncbi:hypothetical protein ES705_45248 [subsurface metagenome]